MIYLKTIPVVIMICFSLIMLGASWVKEDVESNSLDGYHCAKIVKVSTMEEAKKQIEINQVMTGVKG